MNFNITLEEFIEQFDKEFDNETMIEKYYIYVKELFTSYSKTLKLEKQIKKDNESLNNIINKIKEYINVFISKGSGYLKDLVEIMKDIPKKIFYEIIVFIMEKFNECGKQCLKDMQKFCRYNSLIYFEKALFYFKNYISDMKNINKICPKKIVDICKHQYETTKIYLEDINSDAILLCQDSIRIGKIISIGCGFTRKIKGLTYGLNDDKEKYELVLENYEKMYVNLQGKTNKEEAICLANIIKINYQFLGNSNYKNYLKLGERCEFICKKLKIDPKTEWYQEFKKMYNLLKDTYRTLTQNQIKENIKTKYKDKFDEIDEKFNKRTNDIEFINFVLEKYPYTQYEQNKNNNIIDFKKESQELLNFLRNKYHPDQYELKEDNEEEQLKYCIIEYIESMLTILYENI